MYNLNQIQGLYISVGDIVVDEFDTKGVITYSNPNTGTVYVMWSDGSSGCFECEEINNLIPTGENIYLELVNLLSSI